MEDIEMGDTASFVNESAGDGDNEREQIRVVKDSGGGGTAGKASFSTPALRTSHPINFRKDSIRDRLCSFDEEEGLLADDAQLSPGDREEIKRLLVSGCSCDICMSKMKDKILGILSTNFSNRKDKLNYSQHNGDRTEVDSAEATFKAIHYETRFRYSDELLSSNYLRLCWPTITESTEDGIPLINALRKKPLLVNDLLAEFDQCLWFKKLDEKDPHAETTIVADLSMFNRRSTYDYDVKFLATLFECNKKLKEKVLTHPLVGVLSALKWKKYETYGRVYLLFSIFLTLLLTAYTILVFLVECPQKSFGRHEKKTCVPSQTANIFAIFLTLLAVILSFKFMLNCFNCYLNRRVRKSFRSAAEFLCIINIYVNCTSIIFGYPIYKHQASIAAFGLIITWALPLFHSRKLISFGVYVETLSAVLKNYAKFFVEASFLFFGFAISYCVLIQGERDFSVVPVLQAMVRVITGRVGYADFTSKDILVPYPWASFLFYVIYCVTIVIVLMSILIGLAINGIQETKKHSAMNSLIKSMNDIVEFEEFVCALTQSPFGNCVSCCKSFLKRRYSINQFLEDENYVEFKPHNVKCNLIPKTVKQAAYDLLIEGKENCNTETYGRRHRITSVHHRNHAERK